MPEIPDPFAVPDEPPLGRPRPGGEGSWRHRWAIRMRSGLGASLSELTDRYEDLLRSAEEMREIGNTRMAEDFQRMAEQVKNQVKRAQRAAVFGGLPSAEHTSAQMAEQYTSSRLARKPDGSWVDMPEPAVRGPSKIAGGVGELPLKSYKTPDFIRSLKGDSDLVKWVQGVAGAIGEPNAEDLVGDAYQSAFHIRQNPGENALIELSKKFGWRYAPRSRFTETLPAMDPVEGLLFHLRNAEDFSGQVGGGAKYLDETFPGLRQEKAIVGRVPGDRLGPNPLRNFDPQPRRGGVPPGQRHRAPGRWDFTVGELLDDIAKHPEVSGEWRSSAEVSKKAIAFASMERFGHPEYAEQIIMVSDYIDTIGSEGGDAYMRGGSSVRLQEGLSSQLGRPELHDKVAALRPPGTGSSQKWIDEAADSAEQIARELGGLEPEYVSPTGPTGRRLSPPMPPSPMRLPTGEHGGRVGTDPLRPMPAMNYNLETHPEFFNPQRQLPRAALTPDDVFGLAEKNVVGGMDLDMAATKDFWGEMADDPRRPQPRSPAIGELMPGPKGGYPGGGGPPVGRGLSESPFPHAAGLGGRPARMPDRDAYRLLSPSPKALPFGQRVPGGVQLQMQFASGGKPIAMHGPVLSAFYKMFPGQSVKDAATLLSRTPSALGHLLGNFGDDAVRLALKLPK